MPSKLPPIIFVLGRTRGRAGSGLLRGEQLADIIHPVAEERGTTVDVIFGPDRVSGAVAIVNKTAILEHGRAGIEMLLAAGNRVFLDPIDGPRNADVENLAHGFFASSILQYRQFASAHAEKPVILLPHHADVRLSAFRCAADGYRCAYVGDPLQGTHLNELIANGLIDLVEATNRNGAWMSALPLYSCHYAVRPTSSHSRLFKPFTKGQLAAECGAVIIVDGHDHEARLNLGENYPYQVDSASGASAVVDDLRRIASSYGGPEWRTAAAAMEHLRHAASPARLRDIFLRECIDAGALFG